jgi:hypothetical protein
MNATIAPTLWWVRSSDEEITERACRKNLGRPKAKKRKAARKRA